jgi:glycine/D-amino acid oxidase-like deaminating enzyme
MTERIECAVIGAGVVGLAIARRLAAAGREVVILEAERVDYRRLRGRAAGGLACSSPSITYEAV